MSQSINKATILGYLGADPMIRTSEKSKFASFRLATTDSWKDRTSGEWKSRTEWHNVVVFSPYFVDKIEKDVKKGTRLMIEGQMQTREYNDKDGGKRYTTEIVVSQYRGDMIVFDPPMPKPDVIDTTGMHEEAMQNVADPMHGMEAGTDVLSPNDIPF